MPKLINFEIFYFKCALRKFLKSLKMDNWSERREDTNIANK